MDEFGVAIFLVSSRSMFFYACSHAYLSQSTCSGAFMPCFVLISMFLHVYMFRSICLGFYAMFPWFFFPSFCFVLKLGLYAHMLDIMSMVMLCSDLCVRMLFAMIYAQIPYMLICLDSCSTMFMCQLSHVHTCVAMPMPRSIFLYACVLGSRFLHAYMSTSMFLHARVLRSMLYVLYAIYMCLCTPCHVCVLRPRLCLSCHVPLQPFCRFIFLS